MHKQKHQQVLCHTQSRAFFFFHQDVSVKINTIMAQTITSDTAEAAAQTIPPLQTPYELSSPLISPSNSFSSPSVVAHKPPLNMMGHHNVCLHNSLSLFYS
jgi:hypothetical protein